MTWTLATSRVRSALAVIIGGFFGTATRYGIYQLLPVQSDDFPTATFAVNIIGAFAMGVVVAAFVKQSTWRLLIGTGFCGAFTTYSSLAVDTVMLARSGEVALAITYQALTLVSGLAAAGAGVMLMHRSEA